MFAVDLPTAAKRVYAGMAGPVAHRAAVEEAQSGLLDRAQAGARPRPARPWTRPKPACLIVDSKSRVPSQSRTALKPRLTSFPLRVGCISCSTQSTQTPYGRLWREASLAPTLPHAPAQPRFEK